MMKLMLNSNCFEFFVQFMSFIYNINLQFCFCITLFTFASYCVLVLVIFLRIYRHFPFSASHYVLVLVIFLSIYRQFPFSASHCAFLVLRTSNSDGDRCSVGNCRGKLLPNILVLVKKGGTFTRSALHKRWTIPCSCAAVCEWSLIEPRSADVLAQFHAAVCKCSLI